jgi:hypothetical protein
MVGLASTDFGIDGLTGLRAMRFLMIVLDSHLERLSMSHARFAELGSHAA